MAASIPCTFQIPFTPKPINSSVPQPKFSSKFLGTQTSLSWARPSRIGPSNGSRTQCWFKFGKNGVDAEGAGIYGSQGRDDFDRDDVEQVFFFFFLKHACCFSSLGNQFFNCFEIPRRVRLQSVVRLTPSVLHVKFSMNLP